MCSLTLQILKLDGFNRIYAVEGFAEEFDKVVSEKKNDGRYHNWLRRKLFVLDDSGYVALSDRDFEPLENSDPKMYAIRYPKSPKNPRVIYAYVDNGEVYLLHTFKETSKKTGSDYRSAIKIAENRLKSIKE